MTNDAKFRRLGKLLRELTARVAKLEGGLGESIAGRHYNARIRLIQTTVANFYEIPPSVMMVKLRPYHISHPRQVAMMLAHHYTSLSLAEIGRSFGGRDHGTVLYATRAVANRCATEPNYAVELAEVRARVADALDGNDLPLFAKRTSA